MPSCLCITDILQFNFFILHLTCQHCVQVRLRAKSKCSSLCKENNALIFFNLTFIHLFVSSGEEFNSVQNKVSSKERAFFPNRENIFPFMVFLLYFFSDSQCYALWWPLSAPNGCLPKHLKKFAFLLSRLVVCECRWPPGLGAKHLPQDFR